MFCKDCGGSGQRLGMGMMQEECPYCIDGQISDGKKPQPAFDKRSKQYRDAIASIMKRAKVSREKAMHLFETEYAK